MVFERIGWGKFPPGVKVATRLCVPADRLEVVNVAVALPFVAAAPISVVPPKKLIVAFCGIPCFCAGSVPASPNVEEPAGDAASVMLCDCACASPAEAANRASE